MRPRANSAGVSQTGGAAASGAPGADVSVPTIPAPRPSGGGGGALPRKRRLGTEMVFRGLSTAAGAAVLVIIVAIATFLVVKAIPALRADTKNFLTYKEWFPDDPKPNFGIAATATGTLITAALALLLAVPVALGIALCLSHYAHRRVATSLGFVIDLLAAVPSIVFGLWGRDYFVGPVQSLSSWLHHYLGNWWILGDGKLPIIHRPVGSFFGSEGPYGQSILLGSIVLAIMVLPIITSLSREVFLQTPKMDEEAAYALGATKWEMIRTAVLPYGRPGIIAAVMLGLGRALGETIALALTLGITFDISFNVIKTGGNSIAANIANKFGEAGEVGRGALIASGLVLFTITLIVNMTARAIVYRRREFVGSAT